MSFVAFKRSVVKLGRIRGVSHLIPGDNGLFVAWEGGVSPNKLVDGLTG